MTTERLTNLIADMPGEVLHMFCFSDSKIDMTNIKLVCGQDAKTVIRDEAALRIAGNYSGKLKRNLIE